MEKNGSIHLTDEEKKLVEMDLIPERISRDWNLSLAELKVMINNSGVPESNVIQSENLKASPKATDSFNSSTPF